MDLFILKTFIKSAMLKTLGQVNIILLKSKSIFSVCDKSDILNSTVDYQFYCLSLYLIYLAV